MGMSRSFRGAPTGFKRGGVHPDGPMSSGSKTTAQGTVMNARDNDNSRGPIGGSKKTKVSKGYGKS